jgi:hypothetical protein
MPIHPQLVENTYCSLRQIEQECGILTWNQYTGTKLVYGRPDGITLRQMKSPLVSQFTKRHFSLGGELNWRQSTR